MTSEPSSSPTTSGQAVCYRHPDRPTGLACSNCGRPICGRCAVPGTVGQFCPECASERGRQRIIPARQPAAASLRRMAPTTFLLLAATIGVFLITRVSPDLRGDVAFELAQVNARVATGEWYRIFSPVLVHANITHILFNMWALYQLGPAVERRVGALSYLGLYLAAAGWGGAFAFQFGGLGDVLVGASGAIFGLFGLWLHSAFRLRDTAFGRNLLSSLGFTLLLNAALPFLIPGISWQGHLGGLVAGIVIGELWSRVRDPRRRALVPVGMAVLAVLAVAL